MATKVPRWVMGCGVGCVGLTLVVIVMLAGGFFFFRDSLQEFEAADRTMGSVTERFGPIQGYRPAPGGAVEPGRMDAFLAAQAAFAPVREETEACLATLSGDGSRMGKLMASLGLLHRAAGFVRERGEALQETGIGPGEYTYLYTLVYFSWLGKSPADGPSFKLVNDRGYILENIENVPEAEVRKERMDVTRRNLNGLLLPVLRNQLADLDAEGGAGESDGWRQVLAAEIAALDADPRRLPWEDGLPEPIESSFEAYRNRLEENYRPMCNALEVGLARR